MGTLYVVGTPIGNLEDITQRALRILREVALIAAEDTRRTRKLLQHFGIDTPLISYHQHSRSARREQILRTLQRQDVALVCDAGMPGLSDPGAELIRAALERGIPVVPIPGPTAVITALVISGLPTDRFLYLGFLPRQPSARRKALEEVADLPYTLIVFEAPHRLLESLTDILAVLGDRPIAVARELTKMYEEVWRGTVSQALEHFRDYAPRGEFTLVIGGAEVKETRWDEERVRREMARLLEEGLSRTEAARRVARQSGWPRREIYRMVL